MYHRCDGCSKAKARRRIFGRNERVSVVGGEGADKYGCGVKAKSEGTKARREGASFRQNVVNMGDIHSTDIYFVILLQPPHSPPPSSGEGGGRTVWKAKQGRRAIENEA